MPKQSKRTCSTKTGMVVQYAKRCENIISYWTWEENVISGSYCFGAEGIELLRWAISSQDFVVVCPSAGVCLERISMRCTFVDDRWKGDGDDADQCTQQRGHNDQAIRRELSRFISIFVLSKP